jgi:ubiquinone/menaquinone biosynthesis C-methylase UbiE
VRKGFSNVNHPHRELLIKQFEVLYPFTSVLEVGCGYGPNVQLLAAKFPDIEVWGIDINPTSVREGNRRLAEMRIEHARLIVAKADDLSQFADRSFDIVFTDAMLQYIGPEKIRRVIGEMKRISRRALLVVELHQDDEGGDPMGLGFFTPDGWVRDCRKLLKSFSSDDSITLTKIPTDVWPERPWVNLGWIITVVCCRGEGR